MMKSLLFVAPAIGYGGAEKNFIGIANYAVEHNYRVFLLIEEDGKIQRRIHPNITIIKAKIDHDASLAHKYWCAIRAIKKAIKSSNADIVISFIEFWRSACIIATRFSPIPCLVSERADPYTRKGRFNNVIFRIFEMAEGHVFQTIQARDFFSENTKKNSKVIPNPVFKEDALDKYTGVKQDIIVNIARLDLKQKRQDVLIDAFSLIKDEFPNYKLYLYGDGPDKSKIEKYIHKRNLENRIELKGVTKNVYQSLGESRLMVLTSDFEGIPNAVIESMCVGVPVVSTKCSPGGAEFLIEEGVNGLLAECGDEVQVANAMRKILSDSNYSEMLVRNGFGIKEKLDSEVILSSWLDYIEELIS